MTLLRINIGTLLMLPLWMYMKDNGLINLSLLIMGY